MQAARPPVPTPQSAHVHMPVEQPSVCVTPARPPRSPTHPVCFPQAVDDVGLFLCAWVGRLAARVPLQLQHKGGGEGQVRGGGGR